MKFLKKYNNKLVDDVVLNENPTNTSTVKNQITILFTPPVLKKYQSILKSNAVTTNLDNKILLESQAKHMTNLLSDAYSERIVKNIEAVEKIVKEAELNIAQYEKMAKSFPEVNRLNIIQKAAENGSNWKGHTYSYKELTNMNKGISKYIENKAQYDKYELNYNESEKPIRKEKTWIWSQLENTRHSEMDGQTVPITEPFIVVNEVTGDTDELMFPGDFENDGNNCSNICNCDCEVAYV